jgi:hypothetical protein
MNKGYRQPAWTDLEDQEFEAWLAHLAGLHTKMERWRKKHDVRLNHVTPEGSFALAMYGEICNLSVEANDRLKREKNEKPT